MALINYGIFAVASLSFYRLARALGLSAPVAYVLCWLPWIYPDNFGFRQYESLTITCLDALFAGVLNVAVANLLVFVLFPEKKGNAVLAGISVGFAVWGRGNSLPVVALLAFPALASLVFRKLTFTQRRNVALFFVMAALFSVAFYAVKGADILRYYGTIGSVVKAHRWHVEDTLPYLRNIPGFFFWPVENATPTLVLTWVCHILMGALFGYALKKRNASDVGRAGALLAFSGAFIYFGTYGINMMLFADKAWQVANCSIYTPMRVGMTLELFATLMMLTRKWQLSAKGAMAVGAAVIFWTIQLTHWQIPKADAREPSPRSVGYFARNFEYLLGGGNVAFVWHHYYSLPILSYYRIKAEQAPLKSYDYQENIFTVEERPDQRTAFRREFDRILKHADWIVIPEFTDFCDVTYTNLYCRERDEMANAINSSSAPRLNIRAVLEEWDTNRLLVLQRADAARGAGVRLPLPYGSRETAAKVDRSFPMVPVVRRRE